MRLACIKQIKFQIIRLLTFPLKIKFPERKNWNKRLIIRISLQACLRLQSCKKCTKFKIINFFFLILLIKEKKVFYFLMIVLGMARKKRSGKVFNLFC